MSEKYYNKYQGYRRHFLKGLDVIALPKSFEIILISINITWWYFTLLYVHAIHYILYIYTLFTAMDIFYRKFISKQIAKLDEESIRRLFNGNKMVTPNIVTNYIQKCIVNFLQQLQIIIFSVFLFSIVKHKRTYQ